MRNKAYWNLGFDIYKYLTQKQNKTIIDESYQEIKRVYKLNKKNINGENTSECTIRTSIQNVIFQNHSDYNPFLPIQYAFKL